MQGCRQEPAISKQDSGNTNLPPAAQFTNQTAVETTNAPVAPSNSPPELAVTNPAPPLPPVSAEYTIASGDTFGKLAKSFHTTVKAFTEANPGVDPTQLQIGQKIHLPPRADMTTSPGRTSEENIYTVKSGDWLLKIAAQFGTTVQAIREANGLNTDRIDVGQKLKIPVKSSVRTSASAAAGITNVTSTASSRAGGA
jgi:LysM repeat protein